MIRDAPRNVKPGLRVIFDQKSHFAKFTQKRQIVPFALVSFLELIPLHGCEMNLRRRKKKKIIF